MLAEWQAQLSQALVLPDNTLSVAPQLAQNTERDKLSALQGIESSRLALYQELMFNTVLESLQSIYPYTYQLISGNGSQDEIWIALVEVYRRAYPNPSYKLTGAVENLPRFLGEQPEWMARYPFLAELAQYEWLELQMLNHPDTVTHLSLPGALPELAAFQHYAPVWNDACVLQHFEFPIPDLIAALQAQVDEASDTPFSGVIEPQAVDILIYRDPQTLDVRFFCLNGVTSLLVQLSSAQPRVSYGEILSQLREIMPALQALPPEVIIEQAAALFQNCLESGMLLGSDFLHPNS